MQLNYQKTGQTTVDGEQVALSTNGHYAIYVVPRNEREYPGEPLSRYEIVNLATLAMEARVSHMGIAIRIMSEFDKNMESIVTGEVSFDEDEDTVGIPFEIDSRNRVN